ncbi:hypothetical protein FB107DRAFT_280925 [Schizophyllum commune]
MAVYTLSFFFGPIVGPLVSGFINQHADWRWIFRVLIIWVVKAGVVARSSHLEVPITSTGTAGTVYARVGSPAASDS